MEVTRRKEVWEGRWSLGRVTESPHRAQFWSCGRTLSGKFKKISCISLSRRAASQHEEDDLQARVKGITLPGRALFWWGRSRRNGPYRWAGA